MGKEKIRIAAGADSRHGNVFLLDSCFQENNAVGFPEIQLILSIVFFVKKTIPVFFIKSILKLKDHIFAYFIAVLAVRSSAGSEPNSWCIFSMVTFPILPTVPRQPEWDRPMA